MTSSDEGALSVQYPEPLQTLSNSSSACFGTHTHFRTSCEHLSNTVVAVFALKVGSKPIYQNCPDFVEDTDTVNDTCCMPEDEDCIFDYDYTNSGLDYKYHKLCSGFHSCREITAVARADTACLPGQEKADYMNQTTYMFMDFACISSPKIYQFGKNISNIQAEEPIYLQSPHYTEETSNNSLNTLCTVSAEGGNVTFYTLDIRFGCGDSNDGSLIVTDETNTNIFNCSNFSPFKYSIQTFGSIVNISLSAETSDPPYVWVGFKGGGLSLTCVDIPLDRTSTSTTTTTTTTTTTKASVISTTTKAAATSTSKPLNGDYWIIIGAVGGIVLIFIILLLCFCCKGCPLYDKCKRRNEVAPDENEILKNEEDLQDHDDQNVTPDWITQEQPMPYNRLPPLATTSIPANTSFRLRDDPTRYLAAHDLRYNGSEEKTKKKRKRKKKREKKAEKDEGSEFVNSMRSDDIEFNLNDTHTELNGEISRKGDKSSTDV
ncbi:uncharacterized protein LOC128236824 isoform X2 [Mya arenaria]|uniref:uncharacterized protein LOC128236824 isoform X2 n=1 Tax=Mya arenaria TaxID=6604 RepID=UPI0022E989A2|nr:uncharacterized protein LOC128236824 isoform X2 [Mya arenaria]